MTAPLPDLETLRAATRDRLCDAYAGGTLTDDELSGRLALARKARNRTELGVLVSDLADGASPATAAPRRLYRLAREALHPGERREARLSCVLSELKREGPWSPAPRLEVLCVMGSITLDLRGAALPPGGLDIEISAYLAEVKVIVPPGVAVDAHAGSGILGTFEGARGADLPEPGAPLVRLSGSSVLAEVKVEVKLPDARALQLLREDWRGP